MFFMNIFLRFERNISNLILFVKLRRKCAVEF